MPDNCFWMKLRVALISEFYLTVLEYISIYLYIATQSVVGKVRIYIFFEDSYLR